MDKKCYEEMFLIEDQEKSRYGETWIRLMKKLFSAKDMLEVATGVATYPGNPARARAIRAGIPLVDAAGLVLAGLEEGGCPLPPVIPAAAAVAADRTTYSFEYQKYREECDELKESRKEWKATSKKGKVLIHKYTGENILGRIPHNDLATLPLLWTAVTGFIRNLNPHERHHLDTMYRSPIQQTHSQDILKYIAMLQDIETTIEVGGAISPIIKKSIFLKGLLSRFKDIIRVLQVSHGMDRAACVVLLIEEEHRLNGMVMDSKEDSISGSSKDKIRKLEEQVKKLTIQLKSTSEKRVRLAKVTEEDSKASVVTCLKCQKKGHTEAECWRDLTCNKCNKKGHIDEVCRREIKETAKLNIVKKDDKLGISYELASDQDEDSLSESSDDSGSMNMMKTVSKEGPRADMKIYFACDSGASHTGTAHKDFLEGVYKDRKQITVVMANGVKERTKLIGYAGKWLKTVIYIPSLEVDLLSVRQLTQMGLKVEFNQVESIISRLDGTVISRGIMKDNQYLHLKTDFYNPRVQLMRMKGSEDIQYRVLLGHIRQRHMSFTKMLTQSRQGLVQGAGYSTEDLLTVGEITCHACNASKLTRLPRYSSVSDTTRPMPGVAWGIDIKSNLPKSLRGVTSVLCCVCRGTGASLYFPIRGKVEVVKKLEELYRIVSESQLVLQNIEVLQSDSEVVLMTGDVEKWCIEKKIRQQFSAPYVHEQNGHVEVTIRWDFTAARTIMIHARVKPCLWDWALRYVSQTRFVTVAGGKHGGGCTPYESWFKTKPDIGYLRMFGAAAYSINQKTSGANYFNERGKIGILLCYSNNSKSSYELCSHMKPFTVISRGDVKFLETLPIEDPLRDPSVYDPYSASGYNNLLIGKTSDVITIVEEEAPMRLMTELMDSLEELMFHPQLYYNEVMRHPDRNILLEAASNEITELGALGAFSDEDVTELPIDGVEAPMSFIFKVSPGLEIQSCKVKARGTLRGDLIPEDGVGETYAPTVQSFTVLLLIALCAQFGWSSYQTDFSSAFLHAKAPANMYVRIPRWAMKLKRKDAKKSFADSMRDEEIQLEDMPIHSRGGHLRKLKLALYGHPEAAKLFNDFLHDKMTSMNYKQSDIDPCLYIKREGESFLYLLVHVDDIAAFADSEETIHKIFVKDMKSGFKVGAEGPLARFIGLEIGRPEPGVITVSQKTYIKNILKRFNVETEATAPITDLMYQELMQNKVSMSQIPKEVAEMVGCIRYLCDHSRGDLLFAAGRAATDPTGVIPRQILRYIKKTQDECLWLRHDPKGFRMHAFSDASYNPSYYGSGIFPNEKSGAIELRCKKITTTVAQSSQDAEYYGGNECGKSMMRTRYLLTELGIQQGPSELYMDSACAITLSNEKKYKTRNRHMHPKMQALKKWIVQGSIKTGKVHTNRNQADMLTKVVIGKKLKKFTGNLLGSIPFDYENADKDEVKG